MIKLILLSVLVAGIISGCAGSPARMSGQTVNEIIDDLNLDKVSLQELCQKKTYFIGRLLRNVEDQPTWDHSGLKQGIRAVDLELTRRGHDKRYCEGGSYAAKKTPTEARQLKGPTPSVSGQGTENYQKGEIPSPNALAGKGEVTDDRSVYPVRIGDSVNQMLAKLGGIAARIERKNGVTAHQYCEKVGRTDVNHVFYVVNGRVRHKRARNYIHNESGSCLTRLKPINWKDWFNRT